MEHKREGNIYDRIVKENIESIIPALMNSVLGFSEAKIKKLLLLLQMLRLYRGYFELL